MLSFGAARTEGFIRPTMRVTLIVCASTLSACSGSPNNVADMFDPKAAAQHNYEKALADYQNCFAANLSTPAACAEQRQAMEARVRMLTAALGPGR